MHLFSIADDGTPAPALAVAAAPDSSADPDQPTTVALGQASGGATGATRTARVQWGDDSVTEDASVDRSGAITGRAHLDAAGPLHGPRDRVRRPGQRHHDEDGDGRPGAAADRGVSSRSLQPGAAVTATGARFRPRREGEGAARDAAPGGPDGHRRRRRVASAAGSPCPAGTASGLYAVILTGARSQRPATVTRERHRHGTAAGGGPGAADPGVVVDDGDAGRAGDGAAAAATAATSRCRCTR